MFLDLHVIQIILINDIITAQSFRFHYTKIKVRYHKETLKMPMG